MDISTHMGTSYLNIRICLQCTNISNYYLPTIPVFECRTGQAIITFASESFEALCPEGKNLPNGVSTGGEHKMSERVRGAAARFQQIPKPAFDRT